MYRRKTTRKIKHRFNNLFHLNLCQFQLTWQILTWLPVFSNRKCSGTQQWIWAYLSRCTILLNLEVQTPSTNISSCPCKVTPKWWCRRLTHSKCSLNSNQLAAHTLETKEALAHSQGDNMASKITSEVGLTVETTSIIIMVETTKVQPVPDPNSTHRSSRLSSAVTLCSREPAHRQIHVYLHMEKMSWEKSLTPCLPMLTLKPLLFSRTIRDCSKIIMRNPEVAVVIIIIRTIIIEVVASSKITTIKITEEVTHTKEAEVAIIKEDTFLSLTATQHLAIILTMAESRTSRQQNARTSKWDNASMAPHAPSPMETRTWERPNPKDLLNHPNLPPNNHM